MKTIKNMKKIFASIIAIALSAALLAAQDINQATDLFNNGATALSNGEKTTAMEYFQQALAMASSLGEAGNDIAEKSKEIIPSLVISIAKDMIKGGEYDAAIAKLGEAVKIAEQYGAGDIAAEAAELVPQVLMQKGGTMLNAKKYAEAAEAYKKVLEGDATNGMAALRLGMALYGAGDEDAAVEAYKQAAANGQEKTANKQVSTIKLKKAAASLKAKDFATAVAAAVESNSYFENAQAYQIAAQASQLMGKDADAIGYFEKYLEVKPDAKNAGQIAFTVGALYQKAGNKEKAVEFYKKASTDPTYGAEATRLATTLK